jgi:hypothetical protein
MRRVSQFASAADNAAISHMHLCPRDAQAAAVLRRHTALHARLNTRGVRLQVARGRGRGTCARPITHSVTSTAALWRATTAQRCAAAG